MNEIIDTNVILRFLAGDNLSQKKQAELWLAEGEKGKRKIVVIPLIVAEVIFVLESFYHRPRGQIAETFKIFLSQRWLVVESREILLASLNFYEHSKHFVDSYLAAWSEVNHAGVLTFDKGLKKH